MIRKNEKKTRHERGGGGLIHGEKRENIQTLNIPNQELTHGILN